MSTTAEEALRLPGVVDPDYRAPEPDVAEVATLTLFTLNGKRYTVPAKPRPVYTLRFLDRARREGMEMAVAHLLPELLGEKTWAELLEEDDLEPEHLSAIFDAVKRLLMGGVDLEGFGAGR